MTWDVLFIGKVIYSTLSGSSGIDTRIYPMRIPQNIDLTTTAAISYYVISTQPEITKDSRSLVDTVRIQISIFSTSYSSVNAIAQLVRESLDGLSGEVAGCSVDSVVYTDETDIYEDEHKIFHRVQEYSVRVKNGASINDSASVVEKLTVTGDYTWSSLIPAGYVLEYMLFDETAGEDAQISAGTSAGEDDVIDSQAINASALTVININKAYSKTEATTVYLNHAGDGDTWNGATVNIYAVMRKVV